MKIEWAFFLLFFVVAVVAIVTAFLTGIELLSVPGIASGLLAAHAVRHI